MFQTVEEVGTWLTDKGIATNIKIWLAFNFAGFAIEAFSTESFTFVRDNNTWCEILTMSSWVLCGLGIVKSEDKNLVDGGRGDYFKDREELLSLECKV